LFVAACAAWAFALYAGAWFARSRQVEPQLAAPYVRVADAEFVLLFLWASVLALLLHDLAEWAQLGERPPMFCALSAAVLYGALRGVRERSVFGTALAAAAALVLVAASLDALKLSGLWPTSWPVAAGLICAAFLMRKASARLFPPDEGQGASAGAHSPDEVVGFVTGIAVLACALPWFITAISLIEEGGFGAACVLLLALLYWTEGAARNRLRWAAHLVTAHAGAFFLTLLVALRVEARWFAALAALILFPVFFALGRSTARGREWLAGPARVAALLTATLAFIAAVFDAAQHLHAGDPLLLAPCVAVGAIALMSFGASLFSGGETRVGYFRAGLSASAVSFALACLRAGYDPVSDVEIYTSPVAVLLLVIAYLSVRRKWEKYDRDTSLLLWAGSLLLCAPLLFHALYFRLLLDVAAPWRDLGTLCASLALILFGGTGRLRAPVLVGTFTLMIELAALALTSVDWLQVPLKYYLMTVGALMLLVFWMFEYRREQILLTRKRFSERREYARERFGEWR
jgi:hypothetical protein